MEAGGVQAAALRLNSGLKRKGYETRMYFLYKKTDVIQTDGVNIRCLCDDKPSGVMGYLSLFYTLFVALKKEKPDVLISYAHYTNVFGQLCAYFLNIPIRIASQRNPVDYNPRAMQLMDKVLGSTSVYGSNVMVSKAVLDSFATYKQNYLDKCTVIYNGVEPHKVESSGEALREALGLPTDKFIALQVGRLSPEKNHKVSIDAVKGLDNVTLVLVGEGALLEELQAYAADVRNVVFYGAVSATKIPELLNACDVLLLPSLYEGMSNVLIEALVQEVPVMASSIAPNVEVFQGEEGEYSLLDPHDADSWQDALIELAGNGKKIGEVKEISKRLKNNYHVEQMVDNFESLIIELDKK